MSISRGIATLTGFKVVTLIPRPSSTGWSKRRWGWYRNGSEVQSFNEQRYALALNLASIVLTLRQTALW